MPPAAGQCKIPGKKSSFHSVSCCLLSLAQMVKMAPLKMTLLMASWTYPWYFMGDRMNMGFDFLLPVQYFCVLSKNNRKCCDWDIFSLCHWPYNWFTSGHRLGPYHSRLFAHPARWQGYELPSLSHKPCQFIAECRNGTLFAKSWSGAFSNNRCIATECHWQDLMNKISGIHRGGVLRHYY